MIFVIGPLLMLQLVLGLEYQCTIQEIDSDEYCVFRDVNLGHNTATAKFTYPADIAKPSQVSFVDTYMQQLPSNFLNLAGPELKVLRVENCGLVSVTVTSGLEALYAKGNSIQKVIVHQSKGPLRTLDLSGNQMRDFSNVTKCQALEELNLSGNELDYVMDLGKLKGLNNVRKLNLSHNDINYLDNNGNVNLESLEDLDLSYNNILPSDLDIAIFYPYTKLKTLRLNNNLMSRLDYVYLLNIKPLQMVYLNGNNFKCTYLESMLNHLQQNNLQTPPGESESCPEKTLNGFCCTGPLPVKPVTSNTASTTTTTKPITTTTEHPSVNNPPVTGNGGGEGGSLFKMWIVLIAISVLGIVAIIGVVIAYLCVKKNHAYKVPSENLELSKV